jgi:hypothetical protein
MKQPGRLRKAAVVVTSVLLIAGFVSYRAGALGWLVGTDTKPGVLSLMAGSKSAAVFETVGTVQPPPSPQPTIMSGSKSLAPSAAPSSTGTPGATASTPQTPSKPDR